jgi:hypothetical protein
MDSDQHFMYNNRRRIKNILTAKFYRGLHKVNWPTRNNRNQSPTSLATEKFGL